MPPTNRTCLECSSETRPIRLLHKDHGEHHELEYAAADARRAGVLVMNFPIAGRVQASLCDTCGRITLYADPAAKQ